MRANNDRKGNIKFWTNKYKNTERDFKISERMNIESYSWSKI